MNKAITEGQDSHDGRMLTSSFSLVLKVIWFELILFFQNSGIDSDSTQARFVECLFVCISSSLRYLLGASRGCSGRWCWCVRVPVDWCCQGRGEVFCVSISTYIEPRRNDHGMTQNKRFKCCNWKWRSLIWKFANRRWIGLPCCWHKRWAKSWSLHLPWRSRVNNWGRFRLTCDLYVTVVNLSERSYWCSTLAHCPFLAYCECIISNIPKETGQWFK